MSLRLRAEGVPMHEFRATTQNFAQRLGAGGSRRKGWMIFSQIQYLDNDSSAIIVGVPTPARGLCAHYGRSEGLAASVFYHRTTDGHHERSRRIHLLIWPALRRIQVAAPIRFPNDIADAPREDRVPVNDAGENSGEPTQSDSQQRLSRRIPRSRLSRRRLVRRDGWRTVVPVGPTSDGSAPNAVVAQAIRRSRKWTFNATW